MIQQRFVLLTLAICLLTISVFAQKNTNIQSEVKPVEQPQATITRHTTKKKVTPLYQRVTKTEVGTQNKQVRQSKAVVKPRFGSVVRPNIYTHLDEKIESVKQQIVALETDPNHDEIILKKYRASLKRMQKIKAEKPTEN